MRKVILASVAALAVSTAALRADSVSFRIGYFEPRAQSDLWAQNILDLTFQKSDFANFMVSVEGDIFVGNYLNVELGTGAYQREVATEDRDFVRESDGSPIRQRLILRIVPIEGSLKVYPIGRERPVIPYVGGGVGAYVWQYQEIGDFVVNRATNPHVISGTYQTETVSPGYHLKGGIQVPVGRWTVDGEVKYVRAHGRLSQDFDPDFEPFDLSGVQFSFGASVWF